MRCTSRCFNPRPARSSGATLPPADRPARAARFNPRPARSSGATSCSCRPYRPAPCFNPRPARSSGATKADSTSMSITTVSIHAPLDRAGRLERQQRRADFGLFQSTPRSIERGDFVGRRLRDERIDVSIHAPLDRAGRHSAYGKTATNPAFQSTPRSIERGDLATVTA